MIGGFATLTLLTSLAACNGNSGEDEKEPAKGTSTEEANVDLETFTFNYRFNPQHFDPATTEGSMMNTMMYPVYDRLIWPDDSGNLLPQLAESWEYSDDSLSMTLHLREGVTFQDGSAFNAEAVKANLERTRTVEGGTQKVLLASIADIEAVDDLTVTLTLDKPDSTLPYAFADAAGMMMSVAAFDDAKLNPVGAGPFVLDEFIPGQSITYHKWDDYWDADSIHVKNLRLNLIVDTTTAFNSLQGGEADASDLSPSDAEQAESLGFIVEARPTTACYRIYMNPEKATPMADPRVREALNLAIDRQALADGIYMGFAEPTAQYFPESMPYYNPDIPKYTYDPERAKELLAEAGYPDGFTYVSSATTTYPDQNVAVQAMLAEVGIDVTYEVKNGAEAGNAYFSGQTDAMIASWGGRLDPLATIQLLTGTGSTQNPGNLNTPKLLSLIDQALAATGSSDERNEIIKQISQEIYDQSLNVPIVLSSGVIAHREGIEGLPAPQWSDRSYDFRHVKAVG
ncbi:MAG: ABC transporter substrate-binding protein [Bifidobacteriaceae bacterium]|nr:ABC transporter substrate-binding protein [Bifidobacteriaceae bacterium]